MSGIRLEPKQGIAFLTEATEVLYGGAAGGGKSYLLRASALRWCIEVAGIQVYLFRRTLPDLRDNHLRGPTSFHVMLDEFVQSGYVKYRSVENEFEFGNGSVLHLCYCDSENDVEKYRGAEIHVLLIDELTHFSEYQYRFLRSRVRIAGLAVPEKYKTRLPRVETASNPGSIGHAWVKRTFILPKPELEIWRAEAGDGGMVRQFIPAKLADNPYLSRDDPQYADRLRGLGADNLVRAMLDGDWDVISGQAFEKLRREVHGIAPFVPPSDWALFGALDWGSSKPFSFGMYTVANGNMLPDKRLYQRGAIIRYDEFYGWNGKPNDGRRMEVGDVADMVASRYKGKKPAYIVADPSMWKVDGGPSHAENFLKHGVVLRAGDNSRLTGYLAVRDRIAGNEDGPMLYVTRNCHDGFWRTMPDLVMDERHPEDVDTNQEDHCFAAGTMVLTKQGPQRIETIKQTEVMTSQGWAKAYRIPSRIALCVKLTYDDGSKVVCTPEHRFLTRNGWKKAIDQLDEISYNVLFNRRLLWLKSLGLSVKNFLAFVTGFVDSIINVKGKDFIVPFGNIQKVQSQLGSMFIMSTGTGPTTNYVIFNSSIARYISAATQKTTIIRSGKKQCDWERLNGTEANKAGSGILNTQNVIWIDFLLTRLRKFVLNVGQNLMQYGCTRIGLSIATIIARQKRCVSVEKELKQQVFCLHVPDIHNFSLADGSIVHNCYDEVRYACMSRPWMRSIDAGKKPRVKDYRFDEEPEESWRTA